ncbi:MAG: exo-alpha-sialidase [Planctomycetes bacterium]|nr:exo-alpha-sialidase [Planctomycetota bacterium]
MKRFASLSITLIILLIAGGFPSEQIAISAETKTSPKLESTTVVFKYDKTDPYDRSNLYGFNHAPSVTTLADGRLMAAWFSGPYEASVHQVILASHSSDGGRTWSKASVLYDTPRYSDFDPAFIRDGETTWSVFSIGRWTRYPFLGVGSRNKRVGADSFKIYIRITADSGHTWSKPIRLHNITGWNCRSNGIRLSTGELILPTHNLNAPHTSAVFRSEDGGNTWELSTIVEMPDRGGAAEPSVAELKNGQLLMVVRSRDGFLWTSRSSDRGKTWQTAQKTDLSAAASSHNLFRTAGGTLVLTHNPSKPPLRTLLTLRLSHDDGITWDEPLKIAEVPAAQKGDEIWSRQVSYPSVAQTGDGTLIVVWTEIELSASRQSGIIHAARVRN